MKRSLSVVRHCPAPLWSFQEFPHHFRGGLKVYPIDTVAFEPNEARLIDRVTAVVQIEQIVRHYRPWMLFEVIGYCAAYGNADTARQLSASAPRSLAN